MVWEVLYAIHIYQKKIWVFERNSIRQACQMHKKNNRGIKMHIDLLFFKKQSHSFLSGYFSFLKHWTHL